MTTKPIGWKFLVDVPDCAAADVADVVRAQIDDELARAQTHVEIPSAELARVKAAVDGAVALVKRHPAGKAKLELVEAADGRVQATVHHENGHASGALVIVPSLEQTAAAVSTPAAPAGAPPATPARPPQQSAAPGLRRTGQQAKPFVPVASRVGGDQPTGGGGGPATPRN